MREAQLQGAVISICNLLRLRVAHFRAAPTRSGGWATPVAGGGTGYPDLTIVGPGGVMFRELKSAAGRLSLEQVGWLELLQSSGADAGVWRPSDLASGVILTQLKQLTESTPTEREK